MLEFNQEKNPLLQKALHYSLRNTAKSLDPKHHNADHCSQPRELVPSSDQISLPTASGPSLDADPTTLY